MHDKIEPWMDQPAVPQLRDSCRADARLLNDVMGIRSLAIDHPVRVWWEGRTIGSRFHLHHLADDLRQVQNVEGAKNLIRQLRSNPTGFADFRFELHLAGTLGRSSGQKLIRLGGDKAGPDVEIQAKSGQRCGFACFRAASNAPAVTQLRKDLRELVRQLKTTVLARSTTSQTVVMDFCEFPLQPHHAHVARGALRQFLTETDKGELKCDSCHLFRLPPPPIDHRMQSQVVRLRLQIPVPSWEKERVYGTLFEKVQRECSAWAAEYAGLPIFAIEESIFGQDLSSVLKRLMSDDSSFCAALATYLVIRPDDLGVPHGLEDVALEYRPSTRNVTIGIETFGDNVASWSEGYASVSSIPASIQEDWDVVSCPSGPFVSLVRPASLDRLYARVPYTDPSKPSADEATVQRLSDAALSLLEWQKVAR